MIQGQTSLTTGVMNNLEDLRSPAVASTQWLLNTKKIPIIYFANSDMLYTCFKELPLISGIRIIYIGRSLF